MLKKILNELTEEFLDCWDDESKKKVQERVLDPVIYYVIDKMYPYFLISSSIIFIMILLMIMILFLLMKKK
jgi:hypothetical protein